MKRVFPQESTADSHSLISNGIQPGALVGSRRAQTSAAMLGIALSFGTSAPVLLEPEAALAAEGQVVAVLPAAGSKAETAVRPTFVTTPDNLAATTYHTVEEGDSLWHIAEEHQADVQSIKTANGIAPDEVLRVGQVLRVPSVVEGIEAGNQPRKVQRLALSDNVRGSVGGDLSVVFGEELPLSEAAPPASHNLEGPSVAQLEDSPSAQLGLKDEADESYRLTAAALTDSADVSDNSSPGLNQDHARSADLETTVAALPENLPTSMPLSEVKVNPLEELQAASLEAANDEPRDATLAAQDSVAVVSDSTTGSTSDAVAEISEANQESQTQDLQASSSSSWQSQDLQSASLSSARALATDKSLEIAALDNTADQPSTELSNSDQVVETQVYRVKAGDTFWNIASRHGLNPDELMSYNASQSPESLMVGDTVVVPLTQTQVQPSVADLEVARVEATQPEPARDAAIRDHVARIREAANREIDQEALKARIIAVRQSLERADAEANSPGPLEFHGDSGLLESSPSLQAAGGERPTAVTQGALTETESSVVEPTAWTVTDAAQDGEGTQLAALSAPTEAEVDRAEPAAAEVLVNLMAAAPMSPEVYRASPQLPVGEVVTPGMPILPESGEFLPEAPNRFDGYMWPAQGTLTSGYGWRWGRMHRGVDIAGPVGTPIMAAASGVVVRSGWNSGGYGNLVDIRHADGSLTRYAHNSRLLVREGQQVRQGQQIAEMGSTGFSTGPHLHFEVHLPNSGTVNPLAYLPGR